MEVTSNIIILITILMIAVPLILCGVEYVLSKRQSKAALALPVAAACFFFLLGIYALVLAALLFLVYFVAGRAGRNRAKQESEINRMKIDDL